MKKNSIVLLVGVILTGMLTHNVVAQTQSTSTTDATTTPNAMTNMHMSTTATDNANTIQTKINADPSLAGANVTVVDHNGVITVTGDAKDNDQMATIVRIAASTPGVTDVDVSQVKLANGAAQSQQPFTDAMITAKVKGMFIQKKLFSDADVAAMSINVDTSNGVVTLSGTADNQEQINNAVNIARTVKGVTDVKNTVVIKANP